MSVLDLTNFTCSTFFHPLTQNKMFLYFVSNLPYQISFNGVDYSPFTTTHVQPQIGSSFCHPSLTFRHGTLSFQRTYPHIQPRVSPSRRWQQHHNHHHSAFHPVLRLLRMSASDDVDGQDTRKHPTLPSLPTSVAEPIDFSEPFIIPLLTVPALDETDIVLPWGEGIYTSSSHQVAITLLTLCQQPKRQCRNLQKYVALLQGNEAMELGPLFGFIRDTFSSVMHEEEALGIKGKPAPPSMTLFGTLALGKNLNVEPAPEGEDADQLDDQSYASSVTSSKGEQDTLRYGNSFFKFFGLVRFEIIDFVEKNPPVQLARVRVLQDKPLASAKYNPDEQDLHELLAEKEDSVLKKLREFVELNQTISEKVIEIPGAYDLFKSKTDQLMSYLQGYEQIYKSDKGLADPDKTRKRRELLSFFAIDQLSLSPDKRTDLLQSVSTLDRFDVALEKLDSTMQNMVRDYEKIEADKEAEEKLFNDQLEGYADRSKP